MKLKINPAKEFFLLFVTVVVVWTAAWLNLSAQAKVREIEKNANVQSVECRTDVRFGKNQLIAACRN